MPIAPIDGWVMDMDGRMIPGTPVNWSIPADGDDYTYKPPLIPAQWVPATEYRHLVATVAQHERRIAALEALLERQDETQGAPGGLAAGARGA